MRIETKWKELRIRLSRSPDDHRDHTKAFEHAYAVHVTGGS